MTPTRSQIATWKPEALATVAARFTAGNADYTDQLNRTRSDIRNAGSHWTGAAYDAAYDRVVRDCDLGAKIGDEVVALAQLLEQSAAELASYRRVLEFKVVDAEAAGCTIGDDWTVQGKSADVHATSIGAAVHDLLACASHTEAQIRDAAARIRSCGNELPDAEIPGTDRTFLTTQARDEASAEAFHDLFGRYPVSPSDWSTAEVLNPNSYMDKYAAVPPSIKVAHIEPVPGQGVVRTCHYIEQHDVFNLPHNDLGDDRTDDPHFDPEHSRMTTYIDYENGIVVMRQNPSVDMRGDVRVGTPEAEVRQGPDGSVRISYQATNPFTTEFLKVEVPTALMPAVTGDVVVTPGQGAAGTPGSAGVTINGTRADYPSFEAYQDSPQGSTHTVVVDPASSGETWAPALNLPFAHDIGSGPDAFEPFQEVRVHGPRVPPTLADLPGIAMGNPSDSIRGSQTG